MLTGLDVFVQGDLMPVEEYEDVKSLKSLVQRHLKFTGSEVARRILLNWDRERPYFKKVRCTSTLFSLCAFAV